MRLVANSYGKGRVRIMRVDRQAAQHRVSELNLSIMLRGDFSAAYTDADNRKVIATDTIKNVVNIVAREQIGASAETFCKAIADRFLERYPQISDVELTSTETSWARRDADAHCFVHDANGSPSVHLRADRSVQTVRSGIAGFTFLKSTGSGWAGYVHDEFTTLVDTDDRIAATSMDAVWGWLRMPTDTEAVRAAILDHMLDVFANTYSASLQDSLYRMGRAALDYVPEISDIALSCPNKHYLPLNLTAFGMTADNLVFTPTDEPHGQIECAICR
jgi:urate oxidase